MPRQRDTEDCQTNHNRHTDGVSGQRDVTLSEILTSYLPSLSMLEAISTKIYSQPVIRYMSVYVTFKLLSEKLNIRIRRFIVPVGRLQFPFKVETKQMT